MGRISVLRSSPVTGGKAGRPDWRDGGSYRRLAGIDRAGLMWEWLRRDPGYVDWYARASAVTRGAPAVAPIDPFPWGLHFRGGSGRRSTRRPADLACRARSGHAGRRGGTGIGGQSRCD